MFDRFTDRARKIMGLGRMEAQRLCHQYIGTEHLLVGMVEEGSGVAANVLRNLGVGLPEIRGAVEAIAKPGPTMVTMGQLPFTPRTKKAMEHAAEEAQNLRHNYIGTEHLLLGLLCEGGGAAIDALVSLDLSPQVIRAEILECLGATISKPAGTDADAPIPGTPDDPDYEDILYFEARAFFDRYQEFTRTTAVYPNRNVPCFESASYCTFGLTGEAGEIAEKMKKRYRLGGPEAFKPGSVVTYAKTGETETYEQFVAAMKKELGDVLWYVAGLSSELGLSLADVAGANVDKLSSRKRRGVLKGRGDDR